MKTLLIVLFISLPWANEDGLNKKERKYAANYLEETQKDLFRTIRNLSLEQWNYEPSDGGWSIAGICEHLLIAEKSTYQLVTSKIITDVQNKSIAPEEKISNEELIAQITDRSEDNRSKTPPPFEPKGAFDKPVLFMEEYTTARRTNRFYIRDTEDQLKDYYYPSPAGKISAYQWFVLLGAHSKRHLMQIQEVMAEPKFP